ncbi:LysE family translocator [Kiloniella majae]|uniref:LysE family translocator n=1 Tax=Kiloniella majae TaxID=1938558 RepID=UPI000A2798FC|nr:LysE family transporter [Kiloniella majae]
MLALILKGLLMGLAIAAPVGPMALLCLKLSLEKGIKSGIATGLGIAMADMSYGVVALLGFSAVMAVLLDYNETIRLIGGIGLVALGGYSLIKATRNREPVKLSPLTSRVVSKDFILTFTTAYGLTITNPMTILVFLAIFAGLGDDVSYEGKWIVATGIFLGSLGWWIMIAFIGSVLRTRVSPRIITAINITSGVIISGFGFYILLS